MLRKKITPIELLDPSEVPARLAEFGQLLEVGARVLPQRHIPLMIREAAQKMLEVADRLELASAVREERA